jgi:alkaline phosphatase D
LDEKGRTVLGKEQLQWLKDRLFNSNAAFKFVAMGGQFLNPSALYENYANYEEERQEIIDFIHKHQIKNVIFLTGDRHRSELSVLELKNTPLIYDLTVSPLSSGTYGERPPEENTYRVDGTMVAQRNFGLVEVEGPYGERRLLIRVFNKQGKQLWEYAIEAEQE